MDKRFLDLIEAEYSRLETRTKELSEVLTSYNFIVKRCWYNGHYHNDGKEWVREAYPISVIEVCGICDIEIGFCNVSISTKLKREKALEYSFDKFTEYKFEAYGANDYLTNLCNDGQSLRTLKENIENCEEDEICFSFAFPFNVSSSTICELVDLLRNENFYN